MASNWEFVHDLSAEADWAEFEYEDGGVRRIEKGDALLQPPLLKHREIACSDDFEVLEIVSPADFETRSVEAPGSSAEAAA